MVKRFRLDNRMSGMMVQLLEGVDYGVLPSPNYVLESDYMALYTHILRHDESCQDMCGRGDHEAVKCGYRPYFENHGRRCPQCPVHDQIGFPDDAIGKP